MNLTFADVYVYSTFFYTKLFSSGHQRVQRWSKGVDIFSKRLLIFPVHLQAHWCLAAVRPFYTCSRHRENAQLQYIVSGHGAYPVDDE